MSRTAAYRIHSLQHSYNGRTVLEIPQLEIPAGEIWAFVGPNGSGKTTLLHILALLMSPVRGNVSLNGIEVADGRIRRRLRRQVTLIHQKPVLFSTTVWNNVAYGLRASHLPAGEIKAKVGSALERLGIAELAGRHAGRISGGEAQRVVLARGLVLETPIILLDEPTSFLDENVRPTLIALLRTAHQDRGATVIMATHDMRFVSPLAQRVSHLEAGRIADRPGAIPNDRQGPEVGNPAARVTE